MVDATKCKTAEPWAAVAWTWVLPGAGHFYVGRSRRAALWLISAAMLMAAMVAFLFHPAGSFAVVLALFLILLALYVACAIDAYRSAAAQNSPEPAEDCRQTRDPWLAVFLSMLVPGAGQLYLRQWLAAGVFIVLLVIEVALTPNGFVGGVLRDILRVAAAFAAYRFSPQGAARGSRPVLSLCAASLLVTVVDLGIVYGYCLGSFRAASQAMSPTLQPGDRVLARRPWIRQPKRGDLVVVDFQAPDQEKPQTIVKRLVAVEGDTLDVTPEGMRVNDRLLYAFPPDDPERRRKIGTITYPCTVPTGCIFVMGDNVANSYDSRHYGPIQQTALRGVVCKRFWPLDRAGPL